MSVRRIINKRQIDKIKKDMEYLKGVKDKKVEDLTNEDIKKLVVIIARTMKLLK